MDSHRSWHEESGVRQLEAANLHSLASLHKGARGVVHAIDTSEGPGGAAQGSELFGDVTGSSIVRRLMELGFVPGERIEIIEELRPGGDPIAVRIGCSMFALRRREARAVLVRLEAT